jgi:hypothetical protein
MGRGKVEEINAVDTSYSSNLHLLYKGEAWTVKYIEGMQSVQVRIILEGETRPDHINTEDSREENNMIETNKTYIHTDKSLKHIWIEWQFNPYPANVENKMSS